MARACLTAFVSALAGDEVGSGLDAAVEPLARGRDVDRQRARGWRARGRRARGPRRAATAATPARARAARRSRSRPRPTAPSSVSPARSGEADPSSCCAWRSASPIETSRCCAPSCRSRSMRRPLLVRGGHDAGARRLHLAELAAQLDAQARDLDRQPAGLDDAPEQLVRSAIDRVVQHERDRLARPLDRRRPRASPGAIEGGLRHAHRRSCRLSGRMKRSSSRGSPTQLAQQAARSASGAARPARSSSRNAVTRRSASKRARLKRWSTASCMRVRSGRKSSATASVAPAVAHADPRPSTMPSSSGCRRDRPRPAPIVTAAVHECAVDDHLDAVQPMAQDREAGGQRERGEADPEHRHAQLESPVGPDQPGRHEERGCRGRGRSDREHQLELPALDAVRAAPAHDERCSARPDPGEHEQPADDVHSLRDAECATDPERVRGRCEGLVVGTRPERAGDHQQRHADQEARARRSPASRRKTSVRKQQQRQTEEPRSRLTDHGVDGRRCVGDGEPPNRMQTDVRVLPGEKLHGRREPGEAEDPSHVVTRPAGCDEQPDRREGQRKQQERCAADAREDVTRQDLVGADREQHRGRDRRRHGETTHQLRPPACAHGDSPRCLLRVTVPFSRARAANETVPVRRRGSVLVRTPVQRRRR